MEIATKVGAAEIVGRVVDDLKDEAEQYRKMVMETIDKIMSSLGASDVDSRLEEQLIDGILYAFQEQTTEVQMYFQTSLCNSLACISRSVLVCSLETVKLQQCRPQLKREME